MAEGPTGAPHCYPKRVSESKNQEGKDSGVRGLLFMTYVSIPEESGTH